jgi:hypothetical protein
MKQGSSISIKAILLNLSQKENVSFQQIITRYLHERLLFRVSLSDYKSSFVLKGGNLMYAIEGLHTRPTMDIDLESPALLAYSPETVIAEKFEAMIQLGELNSRMKDFYDVYILLKNDRIDDVILKRAVAHTFERRNTFLKKNPEIFSEEFYRNEQRQTVWNFFLKKIKADSLDFERIVKYITSILLPIYKNIKQ